MHLIIISLLLYSTPCISQYCWVSFPSPLTTSTHSSLDVRYGTYATVFIYGSSSGVYTSRLVPDGQTCLVGSTVRGSNFSSCVWTTWSSMSSLVSPQITYLRSKTTFTILATNRIGQLYGSYSTNGGASWSNPELIDDTESTYPIYTLEATGNKLHFGLLHNSHYHFGGSQSPPGWNWKPYDGIYGTTAVSTRGRFIVVGMPQDGTSFNVYCGSTSDWQWYWLILSLCKRFSLPSSVVTTQKIFSTYNSSLAAFQIFYVASSNQIRVSTISTGSSPSLLATYTIFEVPSSASIQGFKVVSNRQTDIIISTCTNSSCNVTVLVSLSEVTHLVLNSPCLTPFITLTDFYDSRLACWSACSDITCKVYSYIPPSVSPPTLTPIPHIQKCSEGIVWNTFFRCINGSFITVQDLVVNTSQVWDETFEVVGSILVSSTLDILATGTIQGSFILTNSSIISISSDTNIKILNCLDLDGTLIIRDRSYINNALPFEANCTNGNFKDISDSQQEKQDPCFKYVTSVEKFQIFLKLEKICIDPGLQLWQILAIAIIPSALLIGILLLYSPLRSMIVPHRDAPADFYTSNSVQPTGEPEMV